MEQKFGKNSIDIKVLREFCEREGDYPACLDAVPASLSILTYKTSPRSCVPLVASGKAERLCVTPQQLSRIRKAVTFSEK